MRLVPAARLQSAGPVIRRMIEPVIITGTPLAHGCAGVQSGDAPRSGREGAARPRRRLHLAYPCHDAGEVHECFKGACGLFAAQGDASKAFDPVEETLDQMTLLVEHPVDGPVFATGWIALDMGLSTQVMGDEVAKVIGIVGRVHDHVLRLGQALDQTARLRAVAPLPRRDREADRQAERIHGGVDLRRQAAF